jgi:hypothetical protein
MKNLYHYLSNIEKSRTSLQEGQSIDFVLNEEYSIRTDIVAVDGSDVYVGLDRRAYELLERAGVMEAPIPAAKPNQINLAQSNQNMAGAARPTAPKPAAKPLPNSGSSYNQATNSATASAVNPVAKTAGAAPKQVAKPTAAATTNANVKAANAAFVANQAKAPQGDQTAGGKTNADFLPGAAGGAKPDAMAGAAAGNQTSSGYNAQSQAQKTPDAAAPQTNTFGVQPQANIPGSPTGTSAAAPATTTAPQSNTFGVQPQANIPGSPTGTSAAAPATATSSLPITTTGGPTAANPASVNPPTQGGPAVTGGFGQETNITTDSPDQIAKRGPMGIQRESDEDDFEKLDDDKVFERVMQLAGVKRG